MWALTTHFLLNLIGNATLSTLPLPIVPRPNTRVPRPVQDGVPVGKKGSKNHERVFKLGYYFCRGVSTKQEFSSILEGGEGQFRASPLIGHHSQLGFNVLFLDGRYTDILPQKRINSL